MFTSLKSNTVLYNQTSVESPYNFFKIYFWAARYMRCVSSNDPLPLALRHEK